MNESTQMHSQQKCDRIPSVIHRLNSLGDRDFFCSFELNWVCEQKVLNFTEMKLHAALNARQIKRTMQLQNIEQEQEQEQKYGHKQEE